MFGLIRNCRSLYSSRFIGQRNGIIRNFSNTTTEDIKAKVLNETPQQITVEKGTNTDKGNVPEQITFAKMLRNSPFVQMGDPNGCIVVGTIIEMLHDNLFIDFGGKYHCVCRKPRYKADSYVRGAQVKLKLVDVELASKFLGSSHAITLHEAEAALLGLYKDPSQKKNKFNKKKENVLDGNVLKGDSQVEENAVQDESATQNEFHDYMNEADSFEDNIEDEIQTNLYENESNIN